MRDMREMGELMHFSNLPKDHLLFDEANKKVICKIKEGTPDKPIFELVALRQKMHRVLTVDCEEGGQRGDQGDRQFLSGNNGVFVL